MLHLLMPLQSGPMITVSAICGHVCPEITLGRVCKNSVQNCEVGTVCNRDHCSEYVSLTLLNHVIYGLLQ